jgi:hypothetical protein
LHHNLLNLGIADGARRSGPRLVVQRFQAFQKPRAPLAHHANRAPPLASHRIISESLRTPQYDPRTVRQRFEPFALFFGQY